MPYFPPDDHCFEIIDINFQTQETEIKFCDFFEDGYTPKCLLKNADLEDGTKICTEEDRKSVS